MGHKECAFYGCPKKCILIPVSYIREESLKLNLRKLFYRKSTKFSPTYKTLFRPLAYVVEL